MCNEFLISGLLVSHSVHTLADESVALHLGSMQLLLMLPTCGVSQAAAPNMWLHEDGVPQVQPLDLVGGSGRSRSPSPPLYAVAHFNITSITSSRDT